MVCSSSMNRVLDVAGHDATTPPWRWRWSCAWACGERAPGWRGGSSPRPITGPAGERSLQVAIVSVDLRLVFCRGNAIVASKLLVDLPRCARASRQGVVEHAACIALVLGKGHEQVLGYHETIAHLARALLGALEHAHEVARKPDLGTITRYLGRGRWLPASRG